MKSSKAVAFFLAGGLALALAAHADFGRTPGTFEVSPLGAATYTIPLWTPPGPKGLEPDVELKYDSQMGPGLAGIGWTLSAVTSIDRCEKTNAEDGTRGEVNMSLSDKFCLAGNRLRLGSGTYGAADSTYRTEIDDFSRITAKGSTGQNQGPAWFKVEAKNGWTYEYGNTTDSSAEPGAPGATTAILRWMLNKVTDRYGNTLVVSYTGSYGFAVPISIKWTPTGYGLTTYQYEATFT